MADFSSRDKIDYKIAQLINDASKEILTTLEANVIGRVTAIAENSPNDNAKEREELVKKEYQFLRKQILDTLNDTKRTISALLKKVDIKESVLTINVKSE